MLKEEAIWIGEKLANIANEELSPVLNLGSSTLEFRTKRQPYIHEFIFRPLEERGVKIIHCDIKEASGVDIVADIFDDAALEVLMKTGAKSVFCNHMLEHLENPQLAADNILRILPAGGIFIFSVPSSYPYHADPIDTMLRPTPAQLTNMLGDCEVIYSGEIVCGTYWGKIRKKPWILLRHLIRFCFPFSNYKRWKISNSKLYWLFRPYKASIVIGRKL